MAYTKQTWQDLPSKTTPINASRLGHIEQGIYDAASTADTAASNASSAISGLADKVDKVEGKGLSTNDFTDALKTKLDNIETGAEVNVQSDWSQSDNTKDDYIKNKPTLGTSAYKNSTSVVTDSTDLVESGAVKDIVGWGNKNHNKGDASKTFVKSSARTYPFPVSIPIVSGKKYKFVADVSNISGYTGADALGLRIAATGGDISSTYAIQTTAQGRIVIEMTATDNRDSANIYCFIPSNEPNNATITLSNVMVVDESVTDYTFEPYHPSVSDSLAEKADNSVIGTVEDGTTASQAYAVGQHFIRNGAFCTVTQAISSGGTLTEGTNYTSGDVASELTTTVYTLTDYTALDLVRMGNMYMISIRGADSDHIKQIINTYVQSVKVNTRTILVRSNGVYYIISVNTAKSVSFIQIDNWQTITENIPNLQGQLILMG